MLNTERLCMGCMNDNGGEKCCPICGYEQGTDNGEELLPVRFMLKSRYLIGKCIRSNGAEISYIGWDTASDSVITVREYFPEGFAHRNPDKTVSAIGGGEYTFNEGLIEFSEINRVIAASDLPALIPVTDVFEENGTVFAVESAIQGITLEEFLGKNGGTLKWEQARALFLPLIDTVKGMNDAAILHRGISAETVIVGRDGKLRISGYTVKNMRTSDSKLKYLLYPGYAAAEQYGFDDMHDGTYTDVYGLSATIFRVLIGTEPPEAQLRLQNDAMTIPARFAEELPRHVLAALANGLQVLPQNRTADIERFKNELVYGEIPDNSKHSRREAAVSNEAASTKKGSSAKYAVISSLCTILVIALIGAILMFTVFKDRIFSSGDSSSDDSSALQAPVVESIGAVESGAEVTAKMYEVPDFRTKYYADIEKDSAYEMFDIVISDKAFSSEYPRGTVCSQSVEAKTSVVRDTKIELVISLGPKEIKMPNLKGMDKDSALLELLKLGFLYDSINADGEKYDEAAQPGVVLSQTPEYGTSVSPDTSVELFINSYEGEQADSDGSLTDGTAVYTE